MASKNQAQPSTRGGDSGKSEETNAEQSAEDGSKQQPESKSDAAADTTSKKPVKADSEQQPSAESKKSTEEAPEQERQVQKEDAAKTTLGKPAEEESSGAADKDAEQAPKADSKKAAQEATTADSNRLHVIDKIGDLFNAPDNTVLIHACNCMGSWGAGIAAAFKQKYPNAYKIHNAYCKSKKPESLIDTAQLIPPSEKHGRKHWVGCLFTSVRFGRRRDSPERILKATVPAMEALMKQIKDQMGKGKEIGEIRMCQINSGLFAVPWEKSRDAIETIEVQGDKIPRDVIAYMRE